MAICHHSPYVANNSLNPGYFALMGEFTLNSPLRGYGSSVSRRLAGVRMGGGSPGADLPQRGNGLQPRVARHELPWVNE